ncbi:g8406 [Coccomyxa elongata]
MEQSSFHLLRSLLVLCVGLGVCNCLRTLSPRLQGLYKNEHTPVVLWHGMGDSCCNEYSIGAVGKRIQEALPGVFVHSIATGEGILADTESSYFGNVNDQVAHVCETIAAIPELANGYNAVGFSQGGQFMRAVAERCQHTGPKMHTLITMGAQHQGVMNVPECWNPSFNMTPSLVCNAMQRLLGFGAYLPFIRDRLVQAQYFKDPFALRQYEEHNIFLADINNDRPTKNPLYAENLATLQKFVMFRFQHDVTVVPCDSAWFGFYNGTQLLTMQETALYQEDWIGLRKLDQDGKLSFKEVPGGHMHFSLDWFEKNIIFPYLDSQSASTAI